MCTAAFGASCVSCAVGFWLTRIGEEMLPALAGQFFWWYLFQVFWGCIGGFPYLGCFEKSTLNLSNHRFHCSTLVDDFRFCHFGVSGSRKCNKDQLGKRRNDDKLAFDWGLPNKPCPQTLTGLNIERERMSTMKPLGNAKKANTEPPSHKGKQQFTASTSNKPGPKKAQELPRFLSEKRRPQTPRQLRQVPLHRRSRKTGCGAGCGEKHRN